MKGWGWGVRGVSIYGNAPRKGISQVVYRVKPRPLGYLVGWLQGVCPGDSIGFSVRYQGELLGLRDPQNRDLRRKPPPETEKSVG